jgi:hypothetical protein
MSEKQEKKLAGGVKVLHQTEQTGAVKISQFGFDVAPSGGGFAFVGHDAFY